MTYKGCVFTCILVAALIPSIGGAQSFPLGMGAPTGGGLFGGGSCAPACDPGGGLLSTSVNVGYQRMGLNFSLPTLAPWFLESSPGSLELQVEGSNYWVGSVGINGKIQPNLALYLIAQGNLKKNVTVVTPDNDLSLTTVFFPFKWTGSGVQWWAVDAGGIYRATDQVSVLAGFRWDQLSLKLKDPVDQFGNPVNISFQIEDDGSFDYGERVVGDILAKLWIPYIGVQCNGPNYRLTIIGSPIAFPSLKIANRHAFNASETNEVSLSDTGALNLGYFLKNPGGFLEAQFEYDGQVTREMGIQVWATASWLNIRGKGKMEGNFNRTSLVNQFASAWGGNDSRGETASYSRYQYSFGLAGVMTF